MPQPARDPRLMGFGRRPFLRMAGAFAFVAAGTAAGGAADAGAGARVAASSRLDVILSAPRDAAKPIPAGAMVEAQGIGPIVTPNDDFYRIDTALSIPQVDLSTWTLKIEGLVDRPYELTYDELLDLARVERYVTLCCVSNEVGGDLVDNAKWLGVPLTELLDRAGLQPEASQIVGMSVDGFTVGFPVDTAYDGREALVAVGMNDEPLPLKHGFPARLVVSGLYGFVSATKWLDTITLNRWEEFDAYWIPRGWSKEGPIKTQSRIDVPRNGRTLKPGLQPIAGVSWAQDRGIAKVEVQIGDGGWQETELGEAISKNTWRQWVLPWDATPGRHVIAVRATDVTGETPNRRHQLIRPRRRHRPPHDRGGRQRIGAPGSYGPSTGPVSEVRGRLFSAPLLQSDAIRVYSVRAGLLRSTRSYPCLCSSSQSAIRSQLPRSLELMSIRVPHHHLLF